MTVYIVKIHHGFDRCEWLCRACIDAQKDLGAHVQVIREIKQHCDRCPA